MKTSLTRTVNQKARHDQQVALHAAMADSDHLRAAKLELTLNVVTVHVAISCCVKARAPHPRRALAMRRAVRLAPTPTRWRIRNPNGSTTPRFGRVFSQGWPCHPRPPCPRPLSHLRSHPHFSSAEPPP